jgi:hypothetical protein
MGSAMKSVFRLHLLLYVGIFRNIQRPRKLRLSYEQPPTRKPTKASQEVLKFFSNSPLRFHRQL